MDLPNYLELTTDDMAATKAFYASAFGFAFTDYGPEYAGVNGEHLEIGFHADGSKGPPVMGFQTDDLEAAEAKVRAAGGEITQEPYGFPGGRRFHFRDPGGNEMLVYIYEE